jgi:hypothetical protein
MTNETATNTSVSLRPLDTTTTLPTPSTEGMDYEGSGFLDVFWKLTARAVSPSTGVPSTTPDVTTPRSTTTPTPRPPPTSSENVFDQYDGYYYDVTSPSTTRRSTSTSTTRRTTIRRTTLPPTTRRTTSRPTTPKITTRKTTPRTTTPATPRPIPVTVKVRSTGPVTPPSTTPRTTTTTPRVTSRRTTKRTTDSTTRTTERPSTTTISTTTPRVTTTYISSTAASSTPISSTNPTTARFTQTTAVFQSPNTTSSPTTPYALTDDANGSNVTLKRNKTRANTGTDDDRRVEQIVDIIAFTTLQILFGEDNDTIGGSNNETDEIAYGSTLYADGDVDWQTRIRSGSGPNS